MTRRRGSCWAKDEEENDAVEALRRLVNSGSQALWRLRDRSSAGDRSAAVTEASNRKSGALRRSDNRMSAVEGTNGADNNYNDGLCLVISVGDFQKCGSSCWVSEGSGASVIVCGRWTTRENSLMCCG